MKIISVIVTLGFLTPSVFCWTSPPTTTTSRRDIFQKTAAGIIGAATIATTASPLPSYAESVPSAKDLTRLQRGHSRVRYLLENWIDITTVCGKGVMTDLERKQVIRTEGGGGGFCERTPLNVQMYLGYKSTIDPLFKADKLMLKAAPLVDPDYFEDYLDIVERYREKADQGSMMAYTSSWGEANPGGGKEIIDEYLEKTKDEVEQTELLLRDVLKFLNLDVIPVSKAI
eukprot:CAMPEP_0194091232 /NCGR_PEP_ID=MMETSP0149-20130528/42072_1 /TAXON_ID=122233 /ORGANISM="Chaetoceros debilis, Strain MM31A-1" /LENGTH=228 /DNA_ID=CAMNT_0038775735 /DNA_START=23 /DNA_END=709 /DNA_ORIENTATION=-